MISVKTISAGDHFRVIQDGPLRGSPAFLANAYAGVPDKIFALTKGLEFEIVKRKKVSTKQVVSVKLLAPNKVTIDLDINDVKRRCDRVFEERDAPGIEYNLYEMTDNIYAVEFKNPLDFSMTFLRASQHHRSINPQFTGKAINVVDFMRWFAQNGGNGIFGCPTEKIINLPSESIVQTVGTAGAIKDWNFYDQEMKIIHNSIKSCLASSENPGSKDYYLIGYCEYDEMLLRRAFLSALFRMNGNYSSNIEYTMNSYLHADIKEEMIKILKKMGYDDAHIKEALQIYLIAGLTDEMRANAKIAELDPGVFKVFNDYFKEFARDVIFNINEI